MTRFFSALATCACLISFPFGGSPAFAQNLFAPAVEVNEDIVTRFELQQRELFLRIVSPARAGAENARQDLIDDALKRQALREVGLAISDAQLQDAMEAFAGRAELTANEFIQALEQRGIARETFADFVSVTTLWGELIRGRFGSRVEVTEADVDRALATVGQTSALRVLLSEIIIPAPPQRAAAVLAQAERISQLRSEAEFSAAARRFSATASRGRGGRLEWTAITDLPPVLRPLILALSPGEVTAPLPIPNAVALFQLRGIEETERAAQTYSAIEYAQFFIPGGRTEATLAEAGRIRAAVDTCDDLYGIAQGEPEETLQRETLPPADIPQDIAIELSKLDEGESSSALLSSDGSALVFLMMCGRTPDLGEDVDRDSIANQLRNERLNGFSRSYLEQLRADARIRDK